MRQFMRLGLLLFPSLSSALAPGCASDVSGMNLIVAADGTSMLVNSTSLPQLPCGTISAGYGRSWSEPSGRAIVIAGALSLHVNDRHFTNSNLMRRGLEVFADWVNGERGGVNVGGVRMDLRFEWVGDSTSISVVSNATAVAVRGSNAHFALAPFSSNLGILASQQSAANGVLMFSGGGSSAVPFTQNNLTFGVLPPATRQLDSSLRAIVRAAQALDNGTVEALHGTVLPLPEELTSERRTPPCFGGQNSEHKCERALRVGFLRVDGRSTFSQEACSQARQLTARHNLTMVELRKGGEHFSVADGIGVITDPPGTDEDSRIQNLTTAAEELLAQFEALNVTVLVGCVVHIVPRAMLLALERLDYSPLAVVTTSANGVSDPGWINDVRNSWWQGRYSIGSTHWYPANTTRRGDFTGMTNADFSELYRRKFDENVSSAWSVASVAAVSALLYAVENASTLETDAVVRKLEQLDMYEFFGHIGWRPGVHQNQGTVRDETIEDEQWRETILAMQFAPSETICNFKEENKKQRALCLERVRNDVIPRLMSEEPRIVAPPQLAGGPGGGGLAFPTPSWGYRRCVNVARNATELKYDASARSATLLHEDRLLPCSGNGYCNASGGCVCDTCYAGDFCEHDLNTLASFPFFQALDVVLDSLLSLFALLSFAGLVVRAMSGCAWRRRISQASAAQTWAATWLREELPGVFMQTMGVCMIALAPLIYRMESCISLAHDLCSRRNAMMRFAMLLCQLGLLLKLRSAGRLRPLWPQLAPRAESAPMRQRITTSVSVLLGCQATLLIAQLFARLAHPCLRAAIVAELIALLLSSLVLLAWAAHSMWGLAHSGHFASSAVHWSHAVALMANALVQPILALLSVQYITVERTENYDRYYVMVRILSLICAFAISLSGIRATKKLQRAIHELAANLIRVHQKQTELDEFDVLYQHHFHDGMDLIPEDKQVDAPQRRSSDVSPLPRSPLLRGYTKALSGMMVSRSNSELNTDGSASAFARMKASMTFAMQVFRSSLPSWHRRTANTTSIELLRQIQQENTESVHSNKVMAPEVSLNKRRTIIRSAFDERRPDGFSSNDKQLAFEDPPLLPLPLPLPPTKAIGSEVGRRPGDGIRALLSGVGPSRLNDDAFRTLLYQAAASLRTPEYSLKAFHDDMLKCFPELRLYLGVSGSSGAAATTTSGRSATDEYLRTIGALFAVYWLCRLQLPSVLGSSQLDGQRGFCFGAAGDDPGTSNEVHWAPPTVEQIDELITPVEPLMPPDKPQKRKAFYGEMDWTGLHQLICDAGILITQPDGTVTVVTERAAAMLTLTAIHDVMKVEALLPTVVADSTHSEFAGHKDGDVIHDHDLALGYVLTHDPTALPCYAALPEELKRPVRFTQAKLGFNHGWLVQAEAPPGPLFGSFKALIDEEGVAPADIAFYFVHWVTDLAGAEPSVGIFGAQQFTCKFPRAVLASFVRSFPLVQRLSHLTCTQLNEEFLVQWWPKGEFAPPPAHGPCAIAQHRLVVQAQTADRQLAILRGWSALPLDDQQLLGEELARTGVRGEAYERSPVPEGGPAFLVYYSPAFVRQADDDARSALCALAAIYRAARRMWPLSAAAQGVTCTVRIDQLKGRSPKEIATLHTDGSCWLLRRQHQDACEGNIAPCPLDELPQLLAREQPENVQIVRLWRLDCTEATGGQVPETSFRSNV